MNENLKEEHSVIIRAICKAIESLKEQPAKYNKTATDPIKIMIIETKKEKSGSN